jgi:sulfite exporter TauE/SafE
MSKRYEPHDYDGINIHVAFVFVICLAFVVESIKGSITLMPLWQNLMAGALFMLLPCALVYLDFITMCERRRLIESFLPENYWTED